MILGHLLLYEELTYLNFVWHTLQSTPDPLERLALPDPDKFVGGKAPDVSQQRFHAYYHRIATIPKEDFAEVDMAIDAAKHVSNRRREGPDGSAKLSAGTDTRRPT